jgi:hypothetical protein
MKRLYRNAHVSEYAQSSMAKAAVEHCADKNIAKHALAGCPHCLAFLSLLNSEPMHTSFYFIHRTKLLGGNLRDDKTI